MKTILKKFKVYAPPNQKKLESDGTLIITGVASTTNKDLDGEIVSEKALKSLEKQAVGLNIHLDHDHGYNGGIGVILDAYVEDNKLKITARILKEYAQGILDRLTMGMNMGFSIGGIPIIKDSRSNIIDDFILLEISLTLLPANWDTFGTVETKGFVESNCLTGACHHILKEKNKKIGSDNMNKAQPVLDDATKNELVNIVNEAIINLKPVILDELKEEMVKLVQDVVSASLSDIVPKAIGQIKAEALPEETEEIEEVEEKAAEEEIIDDSEVVEEKEVEDIPQDEVVEEEKEIEKEPLSGIPARKQDVNYGQVTGNVPIPAPSYTIDTKAIADAVIDEVWKKLNENHTLKSRTTVSRFDTFKKTESKKITKKNNRFLDNDKRDKYGRNKKYL